MTPSTNPARDEAVRELELIRSLVIPMVRERSREPGDAWDQAERVLSALPAAKPPASGVDAVVLLRKFADFKNCTAADVYRARELTGLLHLNETDNCASLSPAATSGSEAGGLKLDISKKWLERKAKEEGDHETGVGSITDTINLTPERIAELEQVALKSLPVWAQNEITRLREALAKPSSPAGGDVREVDEFCPFKLGEVLVCAKPTNFHEVGEVVVVEALSRRYQGDSGPFWVSLIGKPGHYGWTSFRRASSSEIAAALSPSTSAAEPVAWRWRLKDRTEWIVTSDREDIPKQFRVTSRDKASRFEYPEIQPLYAHPAPAAVETYQNRVATACATVFDGDPTDIAERRDRFAEEALETCQAFGMTREDMCALVDYTFGRPVGEPAKEIGAAMTTLASLCVYSGHNLMACAEADLAKLQRPETVARIRAKRATRHGRGSLPGLSEPAAVESAQGVKVRRDDPFRPAVDVDADDDYYPSREED